MNWIFYVLIYLAGMFLYNYIASFVFEYDKDAENLFGMPMSRKQQEDNVILHSFFWPFVVVLLVVSLPFFVLYYLAKKVLYSNKNKR